MKLKLTTDSAWYRALSLSERSGVGLPDADVPAPAAEGYLADYRLQCWKTQLSVADESFFAQRLALDNLTENQLRYLLAEPVELLRQRLAQAPAWLICLDTAFNQLSVSDLPDLNAESLKNHSVDGFLLAAAPIMEQAIKSFDARLKELTADTASLLFDPATIRQLLSVHLHDTLLKMITRTMVLELNIARLDGKLTGDSPAKRFESFIELLQQPAYCRSLLQDYPVLARLLVEQAQRWVTVSLEFLARLCQDEAEIRTRFAPTGEPGVLTGVAGDLADTHQGGQSVLIAKFSSGLRLVYKPRSLALDAHFQELLKWLNDRGANPPFPLLTVLDRGRWGWVQYISGRECQTTDELRRFYLRQGGYLALLYLLEATDFHAANLIACGESPYLIDLEALFHPRRSSAGTGNAFPAGRLARRALSQSVLRSGLLPERLWSNSEHEGIDISGLGTANGQMTPHAVPHWEAKGTDTMHLVRKRRLIQADRNRPMLAGSAAVDVLDYQQEILAGFRATYSLLMKLGEDLSAGDGPLAQFAQDEVCVFLRSSRTYRCLLRESYHPDVLRDALDRDRLFDLLWVEVADDSDLAQVIRIERAELLRGDIPRFIARPGSRDLWISDSERIPDFFSAPSLSIVRHRIRQLNSQDCARQEWFIRASLASLPAAETHQQFFPLLPSPATEANIERLLNAAQAIGDRLETLAFRGQEDASWIGLAEERERCWEIAPSGMDLDGGLPGIILFLTCLGKLTKQGRYAELARAALKNLQRQIIERSDEVRLIGGFDGWGGIIYALTHLGILWQRPDLVAQAESIVAHLPALLAEDDVLDVYGGAAGCIAALRSLSHIVPSDRLTAVAMQCGDHLLAQARPMPTGIGWLQSDETTPLPVGFAHGTTGIAWALLTLYTWTGLERFRTAAHNAMLWERNPAASEVAQSAALPESTAAGEPALRPTPWKTAWCRGAAGIGLARLSTLSCADDAVIRAEIDAALTATLQHGFGHNHSLCHGDAGQTELLLLANYTLKDTRWAEPLHVQIATLLAAIEQQGWRCGTPLAVETPGLLTGLAGIGYQLLRLAQPEFVPSVLLLQPPWRQAKRSN